ncbi:MAG: HlyD family efflux transporter periplasmic adaptor subunit [Hydrogenophaga sp.]
MTARLVAKAGTVVRVDAPKKAKAAPIKLPRIRDELQLFPGAPNDDGTPAWIIQDPVNNRFYRIGWIDFELLIHWADFDAEALVAEVNAQTPLNVTPADVRNLVIFLSDNQLLRIDTRADVQKLLSKQAGQKRSLLEWLVHNYLFFRMPLVRPQAWLAALQPYLSWVSASMLAVTIGLIALLGLYLVSRQWDVFTHTLVDNFTWNGVLGYTVALLFAKTIHELGHAVVATRYGVRVAHMGIAFLVMLPMLYTDTGESWRLKNPRHRLAIASAGIAVELALASIATLIWALAPDGPFRNGMFFLATTSWIMTLAINASPFMRFDGYFIVSDLLDLPNLHERSSALARTWMRRSLLGFKDSYPENFTLGKRQGLVFFALFTWLYRLMIFLGIALLVYHFFFKVLGIVMLIVELVWFVGKPIAKELAVWKARKSEIVKSRRLGFAASMVALVAVLVIPFSSRISGYGWLHSTEQQSVHSPFSAQILSMPTKTAFKAGEVMFVLDSTILGIAEGRSREMAATRESQIAGLMGLPDGESQRLALTTQKAFFEAEEKASQDELARLTLRAPFDGELRDVDHGLAPGVWVKSREAMAMFIDPQQWVVDAYIAEEDLGRVEVGQAVRTRLHTGNQDWVDGRIEAVDVSRTTVLPTPLLSAAHSGPLAVVNDTARPGQENVKVLRDALFRVRIVLDEPLPSKRVAVVRVRIDGESESLLVGMVRKVVAVFVRESGF